MLSGECLLSDRGDNSLISNQIGLSSCCCHSTPAASHAWRSRSRLPWEPGWITAATAVCRANSLARARAHAQTQGHRQEGMLPRRRRKKAGDGAFHVRLGCHSRVSRADKTCNLSNNATRDEREGAGGRIKSQATEKGPGKRKGTGGDGRKRGGGGVVGGGVGWGGIL